MSVGALHQSGIKFLIENFTRLTIMNFIPDWESEIANQSGLKFVRKLMLLRKNKISLEKKNSFTDGFLSSESKSSKKKET